MTAYAEDLGHEDPVVQAQRVVAQQAGCTLDEALTKMENLAAATDETVEVVAEYVLKGEIRLN